MATEMKPPHLPLWYKLSAMARTARPMLRSGILSMSAKQAPTVLGYIRNLKLSVAALISMGALRYPDRVALIDDEGQLTYSELLEQSHALARALMDRGMTSKTSFSVIARNGRGIILPMAIKAFVGAEIMLMNIGSGATQISGIVEQNNVKFIFIDDEFIDRLPEDLDGVQVVITAITDPETRNRVPKDFLFMEDLIEAGRSSTTELEKAANRAASSLCPRVPRVSPRACFATSRRPRPPWALSLSGFRGART